MNLREKCFTIFRGRLKRTSIPGLNCIYVIANRFTWKNMAGTQGW